MDSIKRSVQAYAWLQHAVYNEVSLLGRYRVLYSYIFRGTCGLERESWRSAGVDRAPPLSNIPSMHKLNRFFLHITLLPLHKNIVN